MAETPLWVTLFVGLGAGVLGSLLTTTLRIRHEREADLRSRMLEAADEFVAAATKANERIGTLALRRSLAEVRAGEGGNLAAPAQADLDALNPLWDDASASLAETLRRLPRIRLLFGVDAASAERRVMCAGNTAKRWSSSSSLQHPGVSRQGRSPRRRRLLSTSSVAQRAQTYSVVAGSSASFVEPNSRRSSAAASSRNTTPAR